MEASSPTKWHEDAAPAKTAAGLGRRRSASSRGSSRGEVARGCLWRSARQSSLAGVVELGSGVGAARLGPANGRSGLCRTAQRRLELGNCTLLKGEREGVEEWIRRKCRELQWRQQHSNAIGRGSCEQQRDDDKQVPQYFIF
jgi:hypothetical protein